ncbi:hypothetical protein JVU11DRAFT_273 [Chiua virens]|nr:hypothetical protein JVU11DRAFT_273 [Chiua virens]
MNLNKPLPPLPRPDDLAEDLDVVSLSGEEPPDLPSHVENLDDLSPADTGKEPAQTKRTILPLPQRRDLVENRITHLLADKKPKKKLLDVPVSHQATVKFVGGFDPRLALNAEDGGPRPPLALRQLIVNQSARLAAPPLAEATVMHSVQVEDPIPMPLPQDIPTKPVLAPPAVILPPDQHSDSIRPPEIATTPPMSAVTGPAEPVLNVTPSRSRITSFPPCLPMSFPRYNTKQCSSDTKARSRCRREPRLPATYLHIDPVPEFYCYQHKRAMLDAPDFHPRNWKPGDPDEPVEFSDYIPEYLQEDTRLALRVEMEKGPASANDPGYIYTFEIRDPERPDLIQLKVGCTQADALTESLDQWEQLRDKQCRSKVQTIPRGWWPGTVEDDGGTNRSLLKDNIRAGDPVPFCHYVERLVHIELSDLSLYEPYQHSNWQNSTFELPSDAGTARFARKCNAKKICLDCGAAHREVFTFSLPLEGYHNGKKWNLIVERAIKRWGGFVEENYT